MKRENNVIKKFLIVLMFFCLIISISIKVHALTFSEMQDQIKNFESKGKVPEIGSEVYEEFADLGSILTTIGAGVMVGVTTYMGIKYLTSGPEAQAKLKTQLIGVLVSGIVIFGAYYIWKIIVNVAKTL